MTFAITPNSPPLMPLPIIKVMTEIPGARKQRDKLAIAIPASIIIRIYFDLIRSDMTPPTMLSITASTVPGISIAKAVSGPMPAFEKIETILKVIAVT